MKTKLGTERRQIVIAKVNRGHEMGFTVLSVAKEVVSKGYKSRQKVIKNGGNNRSKIFASVDRYRRCGDFTSRGKVLLTPMRLLDFRLPAGLAADEASPVIFRPAT